MAKKVQSNITNGATHATPKSIAVADAGINNSLQLLNVITATIRDVLCGAIPPHQANSAFRGSREVSKMLELQLKYGNQASNAKSKVLEIGQ